MDPCGAVGLYTVKSVLDRTFEVNLEKASGWCSCVYVHKHVQPCRHMAAVFVRCGMLGGSRRSTMRTVHRYWPKWALSEQYVQMYQDKSIRRPMIYAGPFQGPDEEILLPPLQPQVRPGRPKRKRYRYKPKTVRSIISNMPHVRNPEYANALQHM